MCRYAGSFGPKRFHRGHSAGAEAGITARFDYAKTAIINLIGESPFFRPSVGPRLRAWMLDYLGLLGYPDYLQPALNHLDSIIRNPIIRSMIICVSM